MRHHRHAATLGPVTAAAIDDAVRHALHRSDLAAHDRADDERRPTSLHAALMAHDGYESGFLAAAGLLAATMLIGHAALGPSAWLPIVASGALALVIAATAAWLAERGAGCARLIRRFARLLVGIAGAADEPGPHDSPWPRRAVTAALWSARACFIAALGAALAA